jgi:hypothetical protein
LLIKRQRRILGVRKGDSEMNKMKWIILMFVCILSFTFTACQGNGGISSVQIEGKTVSLEEIEINKDIQFMKRVFCITGKDNVEDEFLNRIFPANLATITVDRQSDKEVTITEVQFYENEEDWWKIQCSNGGNWEEYILDNMETDESSEKTFTCDCEGKEISVVITPYAVSVSGEEEWMQEKKLYQFIAVLDDGSQQEIYVLPFNKSKKMEERELLSLPYLGDGFRIGEEVKNKEGNITGGKLIFSEEVDIDKISDVYVY